MEGASTSHNGSNHQETDYADFFTSHMLQNPSQDQHLDDASAATTLFGASPSPSVSSELSTLSSASSATSHSETEADLPMDTNKAVTTEGISSGALNGGNDVTATIGRGISSTGISGAAAGLVKGVKRSITVVDVAETNSAMEADTRMDDGDISKSFDTVDPTVANTILDKSALTFGHTLELIKPTMDLDTEMGAGAGAAAGMGLGLGLELESWTDLPSPETVEVDELDAMFANV
ncbi:conserved hypothetical protein [Histoplasma capsulatum var. duboisii H88]|uniref:Uncharacterized protein n=1 Tax=Ajellomyces capsulatus (strain H88) TaxID=544711 RepID=F0U8E5_AJEC8|nr:conserved hypothetical protein [Histoplasma capsulatum var. duboisii H88]QSS52660.1 hypothetical protein I7I53_08373 [Histoplasma capsulatum var. duboisii H88]